MTHDRQSLVRDEHGAAIVEFAFVAPVLLMLIIGAMEMGHQVYAESILQGAVQDAARQASLESGAANQGTLDQMVEDSVSELLPGATYHFTRKNYEDFSDVGVPEDFTDLNGNGVHDSNECFIDRNGNSAWDADVGKTGLGSADDVVSYTVSVDYNRLFPLWAMMGWSQQANISANTVLRSQPFSEQNTRTEKQICP